MRQFLKFFFASIFGSFFGLLLAFFVGFVILIGAVASLGDKEKTKVEPNSILALDFSYTMSERTNKDPFSSLDLGTMSLDKKLGLNDVLASIEAAKEDDNIKGIYLDLGLIPNGLATVEAIRNSLIDFKTSGKFIVAYGEVVSQKAYYLGSVADEIYINPVGYLELRGFSSQIAFLKNMLEKLDINIQVFYAGKYKSATEPFRYTEMSEPNKEQVAAYINGVYGNFLNHVATGRGVDMILLDSICDNLLVREPGDALRLGLVDGVVYYDEVQDILAEKTGKEETKDLEYISLEKYGESGVLDVDYKVKDKIAVLYATGNIVDGEGEDDNIGSIRFASAIREIRRDEKIKALVIRINSGGGSALASDVILREVKLAQERMPVIVSMGDVAASGGYYIACSADTILAEPNTVTGSIGVFGLLPDMGGFFNEKLGITFDGVKTGKYSDLGTITRPLTEDEFAIFQQQVDSVYFTFLSRVAEGRGFDVAYADSIGQGRIYTGIQAQEIGLVDVLGGLNDALEIAKTKAGLEEYRVTSYPKQEDPLKKLLGEVDDEVEAKIMKSQLGDMYPLWKHMQEMKNKKGILAELPFDLVIY